MLTTCIAPVPPPISVVVSYNLHKYTDSIFISSFNLHVNNQNVQAVVLE